jgi:hypothetical protein
MPDHTAILSLSDQEQPLAYTLMWLTFKVHDPDAAVKTMRDGLNKTATQVPFLSGYVWEDPSDGNKTKISWSDEGPSTIPFDEIPGHDLPSHDELDAHGMLLHKIKGYDFYGPHLRSLMQETRKPALYTAYTKIQGGLIFLTAVHHGYADGAGRDVIINLLARHTKGVSTADYPVDPMEPINWPKKLRDMTRETLAATSNMMKAPSLTAVSHSPSLLSDDIHGSNSAVKSVLFRWSVRKLSAMRDELLQQTSQPFTLSTMVIALLWALISTARVHTSEDSLQGRFSDLYMAYDLRQFLEKAGYMKKNSHVGNFNSFLKPRPRLSFDSIRSMDRRIIAMKLEGKSAECPAILPSILDDLTESLNQRNADYPLHRWASKQPIPPEFDYSQMRDLSFHFKGTNFCVANWSSCNTQIDFGSALGHYPSHVRVMPVTLDGIVIFLPRYRHKECSPEQLDRFDFMLNLKSPHSKS